MVDLHIHTAASADGEYSPRDIIKLAKVNQLQAIAITDHDAVSNVGEAIYWGRKYGIEIIPGCEFSTIQKEKVLENGPQPMPICYSRAIFLDDRNNNNPLVNQYRIQDNHVLKFCTDWIVTGRPYNAPQYIPEVQDVIRLIVQSGDIPVLAHPAATLSIPDDSLLRDLLEFGLMGIEAFTTWHTKEQEDRYELAS